MQRLVLIIGLLVSVGMCACDGMVESDSPINEMEQALLSCPEKGPVFDGDLIKHDLVDGDFGHFYTYQAKAGQNATFVVEWNDASEGLGALLMVRDPNGWLVDYDYIVDGLTARLNVDFETDGNYKLYVSHAKFGWFGTYPYQLSVNTSACVMLTMNNTLPENEGWEFYYAGNLDLADGDPYEFMPDFSSDEFVIIEREVFFGACEDVVVDSCTVDDPPVCGVETVGGAVYDNVCDFKNYLNVNAGESLESVGAYSIYPECAQ